MIFIIFRENWTTCSQQRRRFLGLASSSTCPGATSPAGWDLNMLCDNWIFPVVLSWNLSARYLLQPGLPLTSFPLRWSQGRHQVEEPLKKAIRPIFFPYIIFSEKLTNKTTNKPTIRNSSDKPFLDLRTMCWRSCGHQILLMINSQKMYNFIQ